MVVLLALVVAARAGASVVFVPGTASSGTVMAAARLGDGGGIVLVARQTGSAGSSATLVRLHADGSLDLGYGTWGVAHLAMRGFSATTLAADSGGDTWVGAVQGRSRQAALFALDAAGRLRRGFGRAGALRLPSSLAGVPLLRLAFRDSRILVAGGTQPCQGCQLELLSTSGRRVESTALTLGGLTASSCSGLHVADAAMAGSWGSRRTRERGRAALPASGALAEPRTGADWSGE